MLLRSVDLFTKNGIRYLSDENAIIVHDGVIVTFGQPLPHFASQSFGNSLSDEGRQLFGSAGSVLTPFTENFAPRLQFPFRAVLTHFTRPTQHGLIAIWSMKGVTAFEFVVNRHNIDTIHRQRLGLGESGAHYAQHKSKIAERFTKTARQFEIDMNQK